MTASTTTLIDPEETESPPMRRAVRATRGRDEVLGVIAHDLRSPLSTERRASTAHIDNGPGTRVTMTMTAARA